MTQKIDNIFELVLAASNRCRELSRQNGIRPKHAPTYAVTALDEIEQGIIGREYVTKNIKPRPRSK